MPVVIRDTFSADVAPTLVEVGYDALPVEVVQELARNGDAGAVAYLSTKSFKYSPDQPRDDHGRFGEGSGDTATARPQYPDRVPAAALHGPAVDKPDAVNQSDWEQRIAPKYVEEAKASGLYDDIKRNGVQIPVQVSTNGDKPWLSEGHHRLAVAADLGVDVPVRWYGKGYQEATGEHSNMTPQEYQRVVDAHPNAPRGRKYSPDQPRDDHGRFGSGGDPLQTVGERYDESRRREQGLLIEPLTDEERRAVDRYIGPNFAHTLNDDLRHGESLLPEDEKVMRALDSAIMKRTIAEDPLTLIDHHVDTELYKGMVTHHEFQVGEHFVDHGFGSTSTDPGVAKQFADGFLAPDKTGTSTLLNISVDPERQHYVRGAAMIDEKILPRDMEYTVTKVEKAVDSFHDVTRSIVTVKATPK